MKVARADIVLVDFPYSDRTGSKLRPALVVSSDALHQTDDALIAAITSVIRPTIRPSELLVDPGNVAALGCGLLAPSIIACWNVLTIDQRFLRRKIGRLPSSLMRQVDTCLKAAFDLR